MERVSSGTMVVSTPPIVPVMGLIFHHRHGGHNLMAHNNRP